MNDDLTQANRARIGFGAHDAGTQQLGLTTVSGRCATCGSSLSSDQRYCVNCGERRSRPRFALAQPVRAEDVVARSRPARRRPRAPDGSALVAGIGTLLLAMGVGVLIGRTNSGSSKAAAAPRVQLVYPGGSGQATSGTTAASTANSTGRSPSGSHAGRGSKSRFKSQSNSRATAVTAAKANAAANKVLGSGAKTLPPATVTVGQPGHGPGYDKKGHFSGTFFGN